jgi:hypothetical protein
MHPPQIRVVFLASFQIIGNDLRENRRQKEPWRSGAVSPEARSGLSARDSGIAGCHVESP